MAPGTRTDVRHSKRDRGRRFLVREAQSLIADAHMLTRRSKWLVEASLFALAAASVLIDNAKIEAIDSRMDYHPAA